MHLEKVTSRLSWAKLVKNQRVRRLLEGFWPHPTPFVNSPRKRIFHLKGFSIQHNIEIEKTTIIRKNIIHSIYFNKIPTTFCVKTIWALLLLITLIASIPLHFHSDPHMPSWLRIYGLVRKRFVLYCYCRAEEQVIRSSFSWFTQIADTEEKRWLKQLTYVGAINTQTITVQTKIVLFLHEI